MVLNWFLRREEALMLQTVSPLILKLSLFLMTAVATHLVMSFGQTLLHYKVAHHPIGGKLFRNHINFHHTHYADDHLLSRTYLGDEANITRSAKREMERNCGKRATYFPMGDSNRVARRAEMMADDLRISAGRLPQGPLPSRLALTSAKQKWRFSLILPARLRRS